MQPDLDLSFLLPWLAIGGRVAPGAIPRLAREHGISRVIDVRLEATPDVAELARHGIEHLHLPTPDHGPVPEAMLWRAVAWSHEALERGRKVLVHCEHGIGRSALVACCLLASIGYDPCEALELVKRARGHVSPSPAQLEAFLRFADSWCRCAGERPARTKLHDLARIAYGPARAAA